MRQFIIGFIVGIVAAWKYFLFKREKSEPIVKVGDLTGPKDGSIANGEPPAVDSVAPIPIAEHESVLVPASESLVPDDLKEINGIGPKINGLLEEAGIVTLGQLANAELSVLDVILENAGSRFRLADPDDWAKQARELMK